MLNRCTSPIEIPSTHQQREKEEGEEDEEEEEEEEEERQFGKWNWKQKPVDDLSGVNELRAQSIGSNRSHDRCHIREYYQLIKCYSVFCVSADLLGF